MTSLRSTRAAPHVVHQPPGCRDDHMHAVAKGSKLTVDRLAAVDRHKAYTTVMSEAAEMFGDLNREFAGRREDNGLRDVTLDV